MHSTRHGSKRSLSQSKLSPQISRNIPAGLHHKNQQFKISLFGSNLPLTISSHSFATKRPPISKQSPNSHSSQKSTPITKSQQKSTRLLSKSITPSTKTTSKSSPTSTPTKSTSKSNSTNDIESTTSDTKATKLTKGTSKLAIAKSTLSPPTTKSTLNTKKNTLITDIPPLVDTKLTSKISKISKVTPKSTKSTPITSKSTSPTKGKSTVIDATTLDVNEINDIATQTKSTKSTKSTTKSTSTLTPKGSKGSTITPVKGTTKVNNITNKNMKSKSLKVSSNGNNVKTGPIPIFDEAITQTTTKPGRKNKNVTNDDDEIIEDISVETFVESYEVDIEDTNDGDDDDDSIPMVGKKVSKWMKSTKVTKTNVTMVPKSKVTPINSTTTKSTKPIKLPNKLNIKIGAVVKTIKLNSKQTSKDNDDDDIIIEDVVNDDFVEEYIDENESTTSTNDEESGKGNEKIKKGVKDTKITKSTTKSTITPTKQPLKSTPKSSATKSTPTKPTVTKSTTTQPIASKAKSTISNIKTTTKGTKVSPTVAKGGKSVKDMKSSLKATQTKTGANTIFGKKGKNDNKTSKIGQNKVIEPDVIVMAIDDHTDHEFDENVSTAVIADDVGAKGKKSKVISKVTSKGKSTVSTPITSKSPVTKATKLTKTTPIAKSTTTTAPVAKSTTKPTPKSPLAAKLLKSPIISKIVKAVQAGKLVKPVSTTKVDKNNKNTKINKNDQVDSSTKVVQDVKGTKGTKGAKGAKGGVKGKDNDEDTMNDMDIIEEHFNTILTEMDDVELQKADKASKTTSKTSSKTSSIKPTTKKSTVVIADKTTKKGKKGQNDEGKALGADVEALEHDVDAMMNNLDDLDQQFDVDVDVYELEFDGDEGETTKGTSKTTSPTSTTSKSTKPTKLSKVDPKLTKSLQQNKSKGIEAPEASIIVQKGSKVPKTTKSKVSDKVDKVEEVDEIEEVATKSTRVDSKSIKTTKLDTFKSVSRLKPIPTPPKVDSKLKSNVKATAPTTGTGKKAQVEVEEGEEVEPEIVVQEKVIKSKTIKGGKKEKASVEEVEVGDQVEQVENEIEEPIQTKSKSKLIKPTTTSQSTIKPTTKLKTKSQVVEIEAPVQDLTPQSEEATEVTENEQKVEEPVVMTKTTSESKSTSKSTKSKSSQVNEMTHIHHEEEQIDLATSLSPNMKEVTSHMPHISPSTTSHVRPSSWTVKPISSEHFGTDLTSQDRQHPAFQAFVEKCALVNSYHHWEAVEGMRRQVRTLFVQQLRIMLLDPTELVKRTTEIDQEELKIYCHKFAEAGIIQLVSSPQHSIGDDSMYMNKKGNKGKGQELNNNSSSFSSKTIPNTPQQITIQSNTTNTTTIDTNPITTMNNNTNLDVNENVSIRKPRKSHPLVLPSTVSLFSYVPGRLLHTIPPISFKDSHHKDVVLQYFNQVNELIRSNYKSIHDMKYKEDAIFAALEDLQIIPDGYVYAPVQKTPLHIINTSSPTNTKKSIKKTTDIDTIQDGHEQLQHGMNGQGDTSSKYEFKISDPTNLSPGDHYLKLLDECGFFSQEPNHFDIPLRDYSQLRSPEQLTTWELPSLPVLQYKRTPQNDDQLSPNIRLFDHYLSSITWDKISVLKKLLLQDYRVELVREFDYSVAGFPLIRSFLRAQETNLHPKYFTPLKILISNCYVHNLIDLKYSPRGSLDTSLIERLSTIESTRPKLLADLKSRLYKSPYSLQIHQQNHLQQLKLQQQQQQIDGIDNEHNNTNIIDIQQQPSQDEIQQQLIDNMNKINILESPGIPTDPLQIYSPSDLQPISPSSFTSHLIQCEKIRYKREIFRSFSSFYQSLLSTQVIYDNFPTDSGHNGFTWVLKHLLEYEIVKRKRSMNNNTNEQQNINNRNEMQQLSLQLGTKYVSLPIIQQEDNNNNNNANDEQQTTKSKKSTKIEKTNTLDVQQEEEEQQQQHHPQPGDDDFDIHNAYPLPLQFDFQTHTKEMIIVEGLQRMGLIGPNSGRYSNDAFIPITMTKLNEIHQITPHQIEISKVLSTPPQLQQQPSPTPQQSSSTTPSTEQTNNTDSTQQSSTTTATTADEQQQSQQQQQQPTMTITEALLHKQVRTPRKQAELVSPVERIFHAIVKSNIFAIIPPSIDGMKLHAGLFQTPIPNNNNKGDNNGNNNNSPSDVELNTNKM